MLYSIIIIILLSCCIFNFLQQHQLKKDVFIDHLTGLHNRKYLKKIEKMEAAGETFFIVACDIDFFKKVNDTYGHSTGDVVLKTVASTLKNHFKSSIDHVIRFGGEEFFIFIKQNGNITENRIKERVEEVRKKIEELEILSNNMTLIKITSSFGVCCDIGLSTKERLEKADKKLYVAKEEGRNRVVL